MDVNDFSCTAQPRSSTIAITLYFKLTYALFGTRFMPVLIDNGDRDFLAVLHRLGGASVPDICAAIGVTATAVRQKLGKLTVAGLVERQAVRTPRGRPHHTYVLTSEGRRSLGDNYRSLAQALWSEVNQIDDPELRQKLAERVQSALVRKFGTQVVAREVADRFRQLAEGLTDQGFHAEYELREGLPILREHHCPYEDLAAHDNSICVLEKQVFETVLGVRLEMGKNCRDGDTCCEFQAVSPSVEGSI